MAEDTKKENSGGGQKSGNRDQKSNNKRGRRRRGKRKPSGQARDGQNSNEPNRQGKGSGQKQNHQKKNRNSKNQKGGRSNNNQKNNRKPEKTVRKPNKYDNAPTRSYGILFYDTFEKAESDLDNIKQTSEKFDQLNLIIKAEGERVHPELSQIAKIFTGAAWTLIHERRVEDGWYNNTHSP